MASKVIEIPDFNFAAAYYPQILEALIQFKRINVPELTDESEFEPMIQLLRAQALVGHLNNVLIDLQANENTLPTARLTDTVRNMLRLIDYKLSPATPANVDIVYKLAKVFSAPFALIPEGSQAATERQGNEPAVSFEANETLLISRTDQFSKVFQYNSSLDSWVDRTAATNTSSNSDTWLMPNPMTVGDAIYFGHNEIMWTKMEFSAGSGGGAGYVGVWEYYDGDFNKIQPEIVYKQGSTLRININSLLDTSTMAGTVVRVTLNSNGAYEDSVSLWDGNNNYVIVSLLGQSDPSLTPSDYTVGSEWVVLPGVEDKTNMLFGNGSVEWTLPQSATENWQPTIVGKGNAIGTCYWVRFRIVAAYSPACPAIVYTRMDTGKQFALRRATQGALTADDPIGSSTGLPDQRFVTSKDYFIVGTMEVSVDSEVWTEVDNFFSSTSIDKHYVVELGTNDRATIAFGSGIQGKIPPVGVNNIVAIYRAGANTDGNVGPETVTVDKTGLTFIDSLYNPRQASGWQEAEGATTASLQRAKVTGPASIRVREVAIGPDDVIYLATKAYQTPEGSKPFARALPIEEGLGPKTIELVLVKKGSGLASSDELQDVTDYFNGKASDGLIKRIVANQKLTAFNYVPKLINIEAVVYANGVTSDEISNNLKQTIQPEALRDDGVSWEWEFGSKVPRSRLIHEIFRTDKSKISNVVLIQPAGDVPMGKRELPLAGTISITVINSQ